MYKTFHYHPSRHCLPDSSFCGRRLSYRASVTRRMGCGAPISTWAHQEMAVAEAEAASWVEGVSDPRQDVAGAEQIPSGQQASSHGHGHGLMVDSFLAGRRLSRIVF